MPATLPARHTSLILGEPVERWLADRRAEGKSWRQIVRELLDATHGEIDITEKTAKTWHDYALAEDEPMRAAPRRRAAAGGPR